MRVRFLKYLVNVKWPVPKTRALRRRARLWYSSPADFLAILEDHLGFIERFYDGAVQPFETTMRKIEAGEEPFLPKCEPEDYYGPKYETEWNEADECKRVIGSCTLGLLAKALNDYLREFVMREVNNQRSRLEQYKGNWFEKYCAFLTQETAFKWLNCPVARNQIEQINLSRNDFAHDPELGGTFPVQTDTHFRKYPVSAFADELSLGVALDAAALFTLTDASTTRKHCNGPAFPVQLRITRENLMPHVEYVRQFCTFVEAQRTKWPSVPASSRQPKSPLPRSGRSGAVDRAALGKKKQLGQGAMSRTDVWYMVRRLRRSRGN